MERAGGGILEGETRQAIWNVRFGVSLENSLMG